MKLICNNCNTENDLFQLNCSNCGAVLREKVANIDLFSTLWLLIESPVCGIKKIIYAEHKNYLLPLLLLLAIKLLLISFFLQSVLLMPLNYTERLIQNIVVGLSAVTFSILLFPLFQQIIFKILKINTKYKNNLSLLIYSQFPLLLLLLLVLPVQFALFGKFWFFANPSPFIIKENAAYVLSGMETLFFLWGIILFALSNYIQTGSKIISLLVALVWFFWITGLFFLIPYGV